MIEYKVGASLLEYPPFPLQVVGLQLRGRQKLNSLPKNNLPLNRKIHLIQISGRKKVERLQLMKIILGLIMIGKGILYHILVGIQISRGLEW